MNKYFFFLMILFFSYKTYADDQFYQVISSHPHDLKDLPKFQSVLKEGRLWIVKGEREVAEKFPNVLRPITGEEESYYPKGLMKQMPKGDILDFIRQVNPLEIKNHVETLSRYKNRSAGSEDNYSASHWLDLRFKELGYFSSLECYESKICNVVAQKKGLLDSDKMIVVVAHFDSVGKSFAGADDNGSGVAVMLEMARLLKNYHNKYTIRFLAANGEEEGLIGSKYHANKLELKGEVSSVKLVINMDMVGYNKNGIVELETSPDYKELANWFSTLVHSYTKLTPKVTIGAWGSDHVSFINKGIPSLLTIEDWNTKTPCYHQACDLPETLNYQYAAEIGKLNLAAILSTLE